MENLSQLSDGQTMVGESERPLASLDCEVGPRSVVVLSRRQKGKHP
jgi:hypothetical protein